MSILKYLNPRKLTLQFILWFPLLDLGPAQARLPGDIRLKALSYITSTTYLISTYQKMAVCSINLGSTAQGGQDSMMII